MRGLTDDERGATAPRLAVSLDEAARLLDVSRRHLERHVLPHVRVAYVGRRRLVPVADLERWLERHATFVR